MSLSLFSKTEKINLCTVFFASFLLLSLSTVKAEQTETATGQDTSTINRLNKQALAFWSSKPDSTIILATQALEMSIQLHNMVGQMHALRNLGIGYYEKGNYSEAVQSYKHAIALADGLNDEAFSAQIRSNLSMSYLALGAHDEALENLYTALEIAEKNNFINTVAHANHNIGMVYHYQLKHDEAIEFYEKSRQLYESNGDTTRSTFILGNIAHLYLKKKDFKKAEILYLQSLALAERQDNKKAIGNALQSLGAFFMEQENMQTALSYFLKAKETLELTGEQTEYLRLLDNLAACYMKVSDTDAAYTYAAKNYELATRQQQFYYIQTSAQQLSNLYEKRGDYRTALNYFKKATLASDSLYSQQNKEELVRTEEKYKYQKDQEQTALLHDMQLKRQKQWLYSTITLVFILTAIALLLVSNIRQRRRTNHILKETNDFFEKQNAQLEASNHFKEQLISLVAHDVRHPIASLKNVLSLFESKQLSSADIQHLMSLSYRDVNNLIQLLDDLLLWVRLQLTYIPLNKTRFQIQDVLEPIVQLYQQKADDKNIQLVVEHTIYTEVYADREAVATVIRNLIDNGIKFSKTGGRIHIHTASTVNNHRVAIYISDTGIGMSEQTISNLFTTPIYARRYGTNNEEGSGLGLQICIHYLQLNNSELLIESSPDQGTTCWFELDSVDAV
ncbi:tetratricopeptide repeat protein [Sphingobacterium phlebotomi]|uniref:histidine kinase n=1 Tax=Sphingobacterium phlebotomi TaxID=2605433 RepID=A0A5D4HAU1_9SPHI|nr:tetratricopeptide repeat-containing sensor histidine kinase [Sphingobacterium phlebotomi]TYR37916.1 tetratricopeptide repeat protein [Sphingobacterium phlebotomi]